MKKRLFKDAVIITVSGEILETVYGVVSELGQLLNIISYDMWLREPKSDVLNAGVYFIESDVLCQNNITALLKHLKKPFFIFLPLSDLPQWKGLNHQYFSGLLLNEASKEHYISVISQGLRFDTLSRNDSNSIVSYFKCFMELPLLAVLTEISTGKILDANNSFCRTTGYLREDVCGKTTLELNMWEDIEERNTFYTLLQENGHVSSFYALFKTKKYGSYPVLLSSRIISFGETSAALTVLTDYSERKKSEDRIQEQQYVIQTILENTLAGYWDWNIPEGTEYMSPAFKKMFGYENDELPDIPESWQRLVHPEDMPGVLQTFNEHVGTHGRIPFYNEVRYYHKNGSILWIICSGRVIVWDHSGNPIRMVGCHVDITDRKMAEENLRISEDYNKVLFKRSVTPLVLMDGETYRFVDCNEAAVRVYGFASKEDTLGKTPLDVSAEYQYNGELSKSEAPLKIKEAFESGDLLFEWRHQRGDGTIWDAEVHLVRFDYGERKMLQFSLFDITDRKQETQRLQQAHATYRGILDSVSEAIYIQDKEGIFLDVNKTVEDFYGYKKEDIVGQAPSFLSAPEKNNFAHISDCIKKAFEGEPQRFEFWGMRKDGSIFPKEVSVSKGDYFGKEVIVAVARDISERKRIMDELVAQERKLREATRLFEALFDAIPDVIGLQDHDRHIIRYNAAGYALLGLSPESVEGKRCYELMGRTIPCELCATEEVFREKKPAFVEKFVPEMHKWFEARSYPLLSDDGEIRMVVEHLRDITFRKKAEEEKTRLYNQLQQTSKMEALGRLAGGVAHDFNNLLTAIIGNATLASLAPYDSEKLRKKLIDIKQAAESAASLTKQLLAFSRKQMIEPKIISLNELIEHTIPLLDRLIGENITVSYSYDMRHSLVILVDPSQFEQIIINLVVNARDAMPMGGTISITTSLADLSKEYYAEHTYMKPGNYCMFSVKDTGIGISKENVKHLFEPFFTTKSMGRGTGLGLATTYGAVKQAQGFIEVYSEEGSGTEFQVYLPLSEGHPIPFVREDDDAHMIGGNEVILLVEDEPAVRSFVEHFLSSIGYTVLSAGNADHALHEAENWNGRIDMLFTDVIMPGMNGKELARYLHQSIGLSCVLFASGYTKDVIANQGVIDDDVEFISKPYSPFKLAQKIRQILDARTQTS